MLDTPETLGVNPDGSNKTCSADCYGSVCVHDRVAAWARVMPEAIAVTGNDKQLTYRQLDSRADLLATDLRRLGVGPEVLVAVFTSRSVDVLTAIIGIFKAGGAYLPLDPASPLTHLKLVLQDAGPAVIIGERTLRHLIDQLEYQAPVVFLEDSDCDTDARGVDPTGFRTDQLAYVIYTSGSTGQPKGIELLHDGLNGFLAHMAQELEFTRHHTMLAIASFTFDVSMFELLLPLYCGGRVVILSRRAGGDGEELAAAIETYKASVLVATPGTWQILIDAGWKGSPSLCAASGGEPIHPILARELVSRTRVLWNHYGPSEATIATTTYRVRGDEEHISMGHAIAGLRLFVLNDDGSRVTASKRGNCTSADLLWVAVTGTIPA